MNVIAPPSAVSFAPVDQDTPFDQYTPFDQDASFDQYVYRDACLYVDKIEEEELVTRCVEYCLPRLAQKPDIVVYGKACKQQRNVGFFSNESSGYNYSTQTMHSQPMSAELDRLLKIINERFHTQYNGILCNEYPDGNHVVGGHSDDERALDPTGGIVAISWGATRIFRIRDKRTKKIVVDVNASHLSVIKMSGQHFQQCYTHEIPKQARVKDKRVSFTFRKHTA